MKRGRSDLKGSCILCGSQEKVEVHHVRKLRKGPKRKDYLSTIMAIMNRKQIPICQKCHIKIHKGHLRWETSTRGLGSSNWYVKGPVT